MFIRTKKRKHINLLLIILDEVPDSGIGKGVVGAAMAGPIGLAAGNLGRQKVLVTCLNCGYQFKPGKK